MMPTWLGIQATVTWVPAERNVETSAILKANMLPGFRFVIQLIENRVCEDGAAWKVFIIHHIESLDDGPDVTG